MAMQTLHPGVYTREVGRTPNIPQSGTTAMGLVGLAERGPVGEAGFVTNMRAFKELYGDFFRGSQLPYNVKGAFDQTGGNGQVFISRIVPDDAQTASTMISGLDGSDSLEVKAENPGDWGNNLRIRTQKYALLTDDVINDGDTTIKLKQISDVKRGDIIKIDDGSTEVDTVVTGINIGSKEIDVLPVDTSGSTISTDAVVYSSTKHEYSDELIEEYVQGDSEIRVNSSAGAKVGQRILMTDGTDVNYMTITQVDGNTIEVDTNSAVVNADMGKGAQIHSLEYGIEVLELETLKESYKILSNNSENKQRYVEYKLKGETNESIRIQINEVSGTTAENNIPFGPTPRVVNGNPIREKISLSGGADGTISNLNYVGFAEDATGVHAFDGIQEIALLSVPGVSSPNQVKAIDSWAQGRGDLLYIIDPPQDATDPLEIRDYRLNELNLNSSYSALVWPYLQVADPKNRSNRIEVAPSGYILGEISNVNATQGVHVPPANKGSLNGVIDPVVDINDTQYDLLYPEGINVIRSFPGEGTKFFGGRTLWNQEDGRHFINIRNTLNFVKTSLATGLRFALFEPNKQSLWTQIENVVNRFLGGMWRDGALVPEDNPNDAFFVKVDEENNPRSEINEGKLHVDVGIQPPPPAEFIVLTVGLIGGAIGSISEDVA
jgi:phage tail sheath protein FI